MRYRGRPDHRLSTRFLLWSGAVGPILFPLIVLVEGALRPGYNAWQTTISTLSLSERGWVQITNFYLFGLMTLCFAVGLKRVLKTGLASSAGPILFTIVGVGLILTGLFVTDPFLGYPVMPPGSVPESVHGVIHNLAALTVFLTLPATCFVMGRRFARNPAWRNWATLSKIAGVLVLLFFGWFFTSISAAADALPGETIHAGLLERITIMIGCLWMSALAFRFILRPARAVSAKALRSKRRPRPT